MSSLALAVVARQHTLPTHPLARQSSHANGPVAILVRKPESALNFFFFVLEMAVWESRAQKGLCGFASGSPVSSLLLELGALLEEEAKLLPTSFIHNHSLSRQLRITKEQVTDRTKPDLGGAFSLGASLTNPLELSLAKLC